MLNKKTSDSSDNGFEEHLFFKDIKMRLEP